MSRASSISSLTDSTLSLNIITVTLNMETVNFLGISIVGQSNQVRPADQQTSARSDSLCCREVTVVSMSAAS